MPKIAILTDIHANLPAFEAVLREVETSGADEIVFGGDLVGYGAFPRQCVERVRSLGGQTVLGNHDAFTRSMVARGEGNLPPRWQDNPVWAGIGLAIRQMDPAELEWLWSRPMRMPLPGAILAHASLHEPAEWHYITDEATAAPTLAILREMESGIGFFGHTHQQQWFADGMPGTIPERIGPDRMHFPEGAVCAMTVGSVGQPRDRNDFRASWVIWDPDNRIVETRRTEYPAIVAAQAILDALLPIESALRLVSPEQRLEWLGF